MPAIAKKARLSVRNWHQYNESLGGARLDHDLV